MPETVIPAPRYYKFIALLQQDRWLTPAFVGVDENGVVRYLSEQPPADGVAVEAVNGLAVPGFQNAHSHAFQFGMAGMAEQHPAGSTDDFWSWREAMYSCAMRMDPGQVEAVAAMLYAEMLRRGYTHVAEFHYLHHDTNGRPYANLAEMGERLVSAASTAGIGITLVPVLYQKGGFGRDPQPRQVRFISKNLDDYFHLLDDSANAVRQYAHARLAFGVHSLRAVEASDVIDAFRQGPQHIPFHMHAAEQLKEVADCQAMLGQRPVEWLLNNLPLDERVHLVHCTHLTDDEVARLGKSKANVVLCPGTEGNLGDGIFRLTDFARHGGHWSIGTDSHISLNPLEDLRWLDYAQRLTTHKRNTFDDGAHVLLHTALQAGRRAMGNNVSANFEVGQPFDAAVYHAGSPLMEQAGKGHWLSAIVYTAGPYDMVGTIAAGKWVVKDGHHINEGLIRKNFTSTIKPGPRDR